MCLYVCVCICVFVFVCLCLYLCVCVSSHLLLEDAELASQLVGQLSIQLHLFYNSSILRKTKGEKQKKQVERFICRIPTYCHEGLHSFMHSPVNLTCATKSIYVFLLTLLISGVSIIVSSLFMKPPALLA